MIRETYADRHHHPPLLESAEILIAAVLMFVGWFAWYVGRERYLLTARQLAELATYLIITGFTLVTTIALWATRRSRREKQWPHPPLAISRKRDERITRQAWESEFCSARIRHSRSALVLAGPGSGHAGDRSGHDRHGQNNAVAQHHFPGPRPCRWASG